MTTKEKIHQLVDKLPDAEADLVLSYLRSVAPSEHRGQDSDEVTASPLEPVEWMKHGKPTSDVDPLWNLAGIIDDDGPTDVSTHTDAYLAEALRDWKNR